MNYLDFTRKYLGRYVDYDGHYGAQCADLMRFKQIDVDGYPAGSIPPAGYAKDIYRNFSTNQYYRKIPNTPTGVPKQGDIIFFRTSLFFPFIYGIAGHVAIFDSGDVNKMVLFEQNYPTGSPCRFGKHTYKDCLGWLTPIK